MNILLVRPKPHKDTINLQSFMICEPLELEYISSYMESYGHNVEIIDMIIEKRDFSFYVKKYNPDVIGFTAYIPHVGIVKEYARQAKLDKPDVYTVVGGVHAEVVPEDFECPDIDYIIKSNALKTFKVVVDNIANGNVKTKSELDGVWAGREKEYPMDTTFNYPFPDRKKTARYRNNYNYIFHEKCATLKTSFGCPYKCNFCFCIQITGNKYFERDIDNVIEEIKTIEEKNIFIVDDNFLVNNKRVIEFCELLDRNNISKNFILFGRADYIVNNTDIIKLLKDHGLKAIFVGIESFREKDLEVLQKKTNVQMNIKAVQILEELGLECYSGIITGMDWEKEDFDNLIKFLNTFKTPMINLQPVSPMPGTPLYKSCEKNITVSREQYEVWDMAHLLMNPEKMTHKEYYRNILRTYYKTSATGKAHLYILGKYGLKIYFRTLWGSLNITWQYMKLMRK